MRKDLKQSDKYGIMEDEKRKKTLYEYMVKRAQQRMILADVINWEKRLKANRVPAFVKRKLIKPYEVGVIDSAKKRLLGGILDRPLTSKQSRVLNEVLSEIGRRLRTQYHAGSLTKNHLDYKAEFDLHRDSERKKMYDYEDTPVESQIVRLEGWVVDDPTHHVDS